MRNSNRSSGTIARIRSTTAAYRWKLVILRYLLESPGRNGELRRLVPTISQKMLTQQLRELEADGIIRRRVHAQVPPRVGYSVEPGERTCLAQVLTVLCDWGLYWCDKTGTRVLAKERMPTPTRASASTTHTEQWSRKESP